MAYETRLGAGIRQLGDTDSYRMLRGKDLDITEATELSSLADADIFLVDDNAAGTQASTNKITAANLKSYINNGVSPVAGSSSIISLGTVTTGMWNATAITHDYIGLDAIDGTNIADNAINSEHYTDGSIDHAHLAADAVDGDNIADNSINSEHYIDGSIDTAHIADDQVTLAKMAGITRGSIIYGDASGDPAYLPISTTPGEILKTDGTDISWGAAPSSGISFSGSQANGILTYNNSSTATVQSSITAGEGFFEVTSVNANKPVVTIKNTHNSDAASCELRFVKERPDNGVAQGQIVGQIRFQGQDSSQNTQSYSRIFTEIDDGTHGEESGKLGIAVASHDGGVNTGLTLTGGSANGVVDVSIGHNVSSTTTIAGYINLSGHSFNDIDIDSEHVDSNNHIMSSKAIKNYVTTNAGLSNDSVALSHMAGITRGSIIVGDSNGDPAYLTLGAAGRVLYSDGTDITWHNSGSLNVSGVSTAVDQSTATDYYIPFVENSSGYNSLKTDNITFNPSTSALKIHTDTILPSVDEDDMASDSATKVPTQQSVKAYVTTQVSGLSTGATTSGALTDVTLTDQNNNTVAANDILVWTGSGFQTISMQDMINNPSLFTFSISSFGDGISTTQLIGGTTGGASGNWKTADQMTFTAGYVAGPPDTSAMIQKSVNGGTYADVNSMDAGFVAGNNDGNITYPPSKDQYLRFRVKVVHDGDDYDLQDSAIYFRNQVHWGAGNIVPNSAGILGLSNDEITNSFTTSRSINATTNNYLWIAYPSTYNDIHADGFKFGSITCPFQSKQVVSVTNTAGYQENYNLYRSTNHSLGNSTLQLSTSSTLTNHIFCGTIVDSGSTRPNPSSVAFDSINQTIASNDITRTWSTVTAGTNDWVMFAWPAASRVNGGNTPTFTVGVLSGGFTESTNSPQNYTNANGYTESYRIFVSNQKNLGAITVITS